MPCRQELPVFEAAGSIDFCAARIIIREMHRELGPPNKQVYKSVKAVL